MNIIKQKHILTKVSLLCLMSVCNPVYANNYISGYASDSAEKNWRFKVFLDDKEIGFHNFSVIQKENHQEVYSNARFDVKFLFFNAYSYRHDNVEQWNGQCLKSINAVTDDNGDEYQVSGKIDNDAFIVDTIDKKTRYLPCVKTFAYWDPEFLKETALLNSQTGEMIEVDSEFVGNETLNYDGEDITARRYRLNGDNLQIDLWYSEEDHWLALESLTENGRIVRYTMP